MFEVLKETPRRLVLASGEGSHRRRHVLDKDAGFAWFEQAGPIRSRRIRRIALTDIAGVDSIEVEPPHPEGRLIVRLTSGRARRIGIEAGASSQAAQTIRGFLDLPDAGAAHTTVASSRTRRLAARTALVAAVVVAISFGIVKLMPLLVLPDCDSATIRRMVGQTLQARASDPVSVGDIHIMRQSRNEKICRARITVSGDAADVGFRVSWNGWTPTVRVTGPVGTTMLDHALTNAVGKAVDDFLNRARDAYRTGNPPRQSDPAVDALLTTMFDTRSLTGILAPSEIDAAIDWFNTANAAGNVYLLAGTGHNNLATLPQTDAMQQQMRGNVVRFADEFGRFADFQMQILAAIAQAQMSFIANGPESEISAEDFRAKVTDVRSTFVQAMKSDFISLVYDGLSNDWRMSRLATLARVAPVMARFVSKEDARGIADIANQTLDYFADPTVKAAVQKIAGVLSPPT